MTSIRRGIKNLILQEEVIAGKTGGNRYKFKAFISYSHAADNKLAPALQTALHNFMRPWNKLRAINVFRDKTNLAVNPALWPPIQEALKQSEFFLLLASPQAAASEWVPREIDHWLSIEGNSPEKLLIVLTDGELEWDDEKNDFDWSKTTALPKKLSSLFKSRPFYLDLRWAQREEDLSLRNSRFSDAISDLAPTLHGIDKYFAVGENVRQYRRTMLLARSAVIILSFLTLATGMAAFFAIKQRDVAITRRAEAVGRHILAQAQLVGFQKPNQLHLSMLLAVESWQRLNALGIESLEANQTIRRALSLLLKPVSNTNNENYVSKVAFRPDGKHLATSEINGTVTIWKLIKGKKIKVWEDTTFAHDIDPAIAFSPDGNFLAIGGANGHIQVWNWEVKSKIPVWQNRLLDSKAYKIDNDFYSVAFSPDGRYLGAKGTDGYVRVWEWKKELTSRKEFRPPIRVPYYQDNTIKTVMSNISFSEDGEYLITGGTNLAEVYQVRSGTKPIWYTGAGPEMDNAVLSVSFSPDGRYLSTSSEDRVTRIWKWAKHKTSKEPFSYVTNTNITRDAEFSSDGEFLATACWDGTLRIWKTGAQPNVEVARAVQDGFIGDIDFCRNDNRYLTSISNNNVYVWFYDVRSQFTRQSEIGNKEVNAWVMSISSNGKYAVVANAPGGNSEQVYLSIWSVGDNKKVSGPVGVPSIVINNNFLSSDGQYLIADGIVWDMRNGKEVHQPQQEMRGDNVAFSPDGNSMAEDDGDSIKVMKWRFGKAYKSYAFATSDKHGTNILSEEQDADFPISLAINSGGNYVAAGYRSGNIKVWEVSSGKQVGPSIRYEEVPLAREEIHPETPHRQYIYSMALSPDGKFLAMGINGKDEVRIWKIDKDMSSEVTRIDVKGVTLGLAFSQDGKHLIVADRVKTVSYLWNPKDVVTEAKQYMFRQLTEQERKQYIGIEEVESFRMASFKNF